MSPPSKEDDAQITCTLVVKIPGFGSDHPIVRDITLEALACMILDAAEDDEEVDDGYLYSMVGDRCLGFKNRPRITEWSVQEDYELLCYQNELFERFCYRVRENLKAAINWSSEKFKAMYSEVIIEDVETMRIFGDAIYLLIKGKNHEDPRQESVRENPGD